MRKKFGSSNPNWKGGPADKVCLFCDGDFVVSYARRDKAKYCSLACWSRAVHATRPAGPRASVAKRRGHPNIKKPCIWCQASFEVRYSMRHKKFCNRECEFAWRKSWMASRGNPNWKGGISRIPYPFDWPLIRRKIRKRDGRICLNPECIGPTAKIDVHHIDYDKSNCDPANLIVICASCNARANFGRERWQEIFTRLQESRGIFPLAPGSPFPYIADVPGRKGSKHPMAKLAEQDIREMRRSRQAGERNRAIAKRYSVSETTVSNILSGKKWSHVI